MIGSAHAQAPGATAPVEPVPAQPVPPAPPVADESSPGTALAISLGGTLASYAVMAGGIRGNNGGVAVAGALGTLILPSAGRWYAHSTGAGSLLGRAAGAGLIFSGLAIAFADALCFDCDSSSRSHGDTAVTLFALGSAAYVGFTIYDIVRAPLDARAYNAQRRAPAVALLPLVQPEQHRYGLVLAAQF